MGMLTDFAQNKINDALLRGQSPSFPATLYFGLLKCSKGARANSTAYALNDTLGITANDGKIHLYKVTTAGTTAASQGSLYPGVVGEVITDGSAVLTEQNAPLGAGTLNEVSVSGYGRVNLTASLTNWSGTQGAGTTTASSGTGGQSSNNAAITFGVPTSGNDWTTGTERIWGWALFDASSAGNAWLVGPLNALQAITYGQAAPSFAAGALQTTFGD